jgi:hypothetical protein
MPAPGSGRGGELRECAETANAYEENPARGEKICYEGLGPTAGAKAPVLAHLGRAEDALPSWRWRVGRAGRWLHAPRSGEPLYPGARQRRVGPRWASV